DGGEGVGVGEAGQGALEGLAGDQVEVAGVALQGGVGEGGRVVQGGAGAEDGGHGHADRVAAGLRVGVVAGDVEVAGGGGVQGAGRGLTVAPGDGGGEVGVQGLGVDGDEGDDHAAPVLALDAVDGDAAALDGRVGDQGVAGDLDLGPTGVGDGDQDAVVAGL